MEMRWIPIEEAMPKANEKVLMGIHSNLYDEYYTKVGYLTEDGHWNENSGSCVCSISSHKDALNEHIVAWMDMPKYNNRI